ncbi:hypothetical protein RVR_4522 [Actinacidiphila reveromycinica]|uniref:Uncharacterized protein n=1 Tax=Actinacidiphila reveromycinica TaxID=659352 RepID=A0A7U3VP67_9ACTN|nr:hypothetical protein [Streptomyces sp. SN-593]BBA98368.1 hypothetical protein RVR_4522 [Streptomyces sp. SN-593]
MVKKEPADYGPIQFPARLGLQQWEFERAQALGLIPAADVASGSRWSAAVVADAMSRLEEIRTAVGAQPNVGAWRAAEILGERFGQEVSADAVMELGRRNLIPVIGEYKGHAMYDGRALEAFADREALDAAAHAGQLYSKSAAAAYLRVRPADLDDLLARTDLDWTVAQATPKGRPSPFAKLPDREPASA